MSDNTEPTICVKCKHCFWTLRAANERCNANWKDEEIFIFVNGDTLKVQDWMLSDGTGLDCVKINHGNCKKFEAKQ